MPEKLRLPTPILLALSLAVLISCKGDNNPVNGGKDTTPPTVVATNPAENAELVPIDSNISVTFSEIMDPATMTSGAFLFDPAIQGTVDYINRVFTFSHSELLSNGITYTATITTEVRDTAGNALAAEHSWQFSTFIDTFPPSIVTTDPTDGYQYASLDGDIVITFSEPMDSASLTGAVFQIDPVVPTSQVFGDSVLTVIPDNPLDSNTTYTATITTAAKDTAGNSFPADYAWQFATYRDTTPPVSSILSPVNNTVVGDSVRIEVTATDSDGIARVEFYADGTPITDAVDSIPPYEYIWTAESLELGSVHELHTVAYDSNGYFASSDTVVVHYLWRLLVSDPDEWDVHRDLKDIYVRSSSEYLEFRVETSEGWASSYIEPDSSGIDVAFFIDIDRNPATGKTTVMNGTIPINDIGAEYRFIIGYHGDSLALWIPDPDPGAWQPLGQVDYLAIADGSYFFEVGIHLSRLSGPYIFDLVVANYTWNSVQSMFKWDWVPDQDSGHVSYEVDHSFEGSPPANMTPECDRTSTDAKRLRTTPFE